MVKLFMLGVILLALKLVHFAIKASWGLTKGILLAVGISIVLVVLFTAGVVSFAVPLLVFGLLAAFLWPGLNNI